VRVGPFQAVECGRGIFLELGVEFAVALAIASESLFADSVDFLEDTALNVLILLALGWSAHYRARMGMVLAGVLLVPRVENAFGGPEKLDCYVLRLSCMSRVNMRSSG